ncbi:hypothetical protein WJX72_007051 [[Myrmecia] bisecta]|uniref:Uncharacterized protein n=1 Tax=[Myrmecia] bisecta TaxID=41462 RepID=A0AAW1Q3W7_9CHLO
MQRFGRPVPRRLGVVSLERTCLDVLTKYKAFLGDLGDVPVSLLEPVLAQCNAQELAQIEDDTCERGRDIGWDLWHLWYQLYVKDFGSAGAPAAPPLQPISTPADYGHPELGVHPGDWRAVYEAKLEEIAIRREQLGQRLRSMWQAEGEAKQRRSVQVIEPRPLVKRRAGQGPARQSLAASASSTGSRLFRKLGLHRQKAMRKEWVHIRPAAWSLSVKPAGLQNALHGLASRLRLNRKVLPNSLLNAATQAWW